jgi:hypothetical protein
VVPRGNKHRRACFFSAENVPRSAAHAPGLAKLPRELEARGEFAFFSTNSLAADAPAALANPTRRMRDSRMAPGALGRKKHLDSDGFRRKLQPTVPRTSRVTSIAAQIGRVKIYFDNVMRTI